MFDPLAIALLVSVGVGALVALRRWLAGRLGRSEPPLYLDEGAMTPVLRDPVHALSARPESIVRHPRRRDEAAIKEYKHRRGGLYESDVVQLVVGAVCARANGFDVTLGILETDAAPPREIDLSAPTPALLRRIRVPLENARAIADGARPRATPSRAKCRACSYRDRCDAARS